MASKIKVTNNLHHIWLVINHSKQGFIKACVIIAFSQEFAEKSTIIQLSKEKWCHDINDLWAIDLGFTKSGYKLGQIIAYVYR